MNRLDAANWTLTLSGSIYDPPPNQPNITITPRSMIVNIIDPCLTT